MCFRRVVQPSTVTRAATYLREYRHHHPSGNGKDQSSLLPAVATPPAQNGGRASCYGPALVPAQNLINPQAIARGNRGIEVGQGQ